MQQPVLNPKEKSDYQKEKEDMEGAISQMKEAIDTLAEVGADQTLGYSPRDNKKFMAGFKGASLSSLGTQVKEALIAASAFMTTEQHKASESSLQGPFTGSFFAIRPGCRSVEKHAGHLQDKSCHFRVHGESSSSLQEVLEGERR
jgi:hypothetical protein